MITKEKLTELEELKGTATSMITITVTGNTDVWLINKMITKESATAINIKNKNNRKNVCDALEAISKAMSNYKKIPATGLCILAGHCI